VKHKAKTDKMNADASELVATKSQTVALAQKPGRINQVATKASADVNVKSVKKTGNKAKDVSASYFFTING